MRDSEFTPAHILVDEASDAAAAQSMSEIKNAMKRHMARMAKFAAWVEPDAIKARQEQHAKDVERGLEIAKERAKYLLPVPDPLPLEMIGQSPSTIQAMLRHLAG